LNVKLQTHFPRKYLRFRTKPNTALESKAAFVHLNCIEDCLRRRVTRNTPGGFAEDPPRASPSLANNLRKWQHLPVLRGELKNSVRCKNTGCNKKKFQCEKCIKFYINTERNCFYEVHNSYYDTKIRKPLKHAQRI
jgi:hypothetical protein